MAPRLVLDRAPVGAAEPAALDEAQQRVVDHVGGPLLVLAGPGTGKTTTVVEAVAARLGADPGQPGAARPDEVLVLTFGRAAAAEVRDRVVARVGGGLVPQVSTFHAFAYALLRAHQDPELFAEPLRLLPGPEQEAQLRELLRHGAADGTVAWPPDLAAAVGTRGLAAEVRAVVAATRSQGLDPVDLAAIGQRAGQPAWVSVAAFAEEYLTVLDAEGVLDYTELLLRAVVLAERPDVGAMLRRQYRAIYVDEYQDTDPMQVRLLEALVTPATTLVAVGDPDQSIYAFRGADVRGILGFRDRFRDPAGAKAALVVLGTTRRFGPVLRTAATALLRGRGYPGLSGAELRAHRTPVCQAATPGEVLVRTYDDAGSEAAHVADHIKRLVLGSRDDSSREPLRWADVAVLVRAGHAMGPVQRALVAAGVPVRVAGDEVPLRDEPAVAAVIAAAEVVARPSRLDESRAEELLLGPLVGLDPSDLRRLGRLLRQAEREAGADAGIRPRPAASLVAHAVSDPRALLEIDETRAREGVAAVRRLAAMLESAGDVAQEGGSPHEVLATLLEGTRWPQRLRAAALAGGAGARRAHRDLDALVALVDLASRQERRRRGRPGLETFLGEVGAIEVPGETHAQRGLAGDAVHLLSAHRSKGLQWRAVVVVGVQEGVWPDLRRRGSVLEADRLGRDGLADPPSAAALLAEERRLLYVAVTRAREHLLVTAVSARDDDEGAQPSRLLDDLGVPAEQVPGRPTRPLAVPALVAALRRAAVDPATPAPRRAAAVRRLALLASLRDAEGRPRVPAADPDSWWGVHDLTPGARAVRPVDEPVRLSGSAVESIRSCPLRWFLSREAHADTPRGTATGFGSLVHALADHVARGEAPAELEALDTALGAVWDQLGFEAPWQSARERAAAREALARFLAWHGARTRTLVTSEHGFLTSLQVVDAAGHDREVVVRGSIDVLEVEVVEGQARVMVHDLKTGRALPSAAAVVDHAQLGVYQSAIAAGAADEVVRAALGLPDDDPLPVVAGGAALVQLRHDAPRGAGGPKVQLQPVPGPAAADHPGAPPADDTDQPTDSEPVDTDPADADAAAGPAGGGPTWVEVLLGESARLVREEQFGPTPGPMCQFCEFAVVCPTVDAGQQVLR